MTKTRVRAEKEVRSGQFWIDFKGRTKRIR